MIMIRLKANVTMPDMHISDDALDFGDVKCGECRVVIVQLHNYQHVKCDWNSLPSDKDKKQVLLLSHYVAPYYNNCWHFNISVQVILLAFGIYT